MEIGSSGCKKKDKLDAGTYEQEDHLEEAGG